MSALKRDRARSYLAATRRKPSETDSENDEALHVLKSVTFDALLSSPKRGKYQQEYDGDCETCRRYKKEIAVVLPCHGRVLADSLVGMPSQVQYHPQLHDSGASKKRSVTHRRVLR